MALLQSKPNKGPMHTTKGPQKPSSSKTGEGLYDIVFIFPPFSGSKIDYNNEENSKMRMKRVERKTWMVLTAGLFKRFKCLLTSSFCLEAPSLVAEDSEIRRPQEHKTTTKYLQYRCFPPISPNPPEVACEAMCWCSKLKYCDSRG